MTSQTLKILALDPGGTTGWAKATLQDQHDEDYKFDVGQITQSQHHKPLWDFLIKEAPNVIIWERFMYQRRELTKGASLNLDAREYIGIAKLYGLEYGVDGAYEQTPAQAKNFWTDDKLKAVDLYTRGMPHGNDAMRHLLYHIVVTRGERQILEGLRPLSSS